MEQSDFNAVNTRFSGIFQSVVIGVMPNYISQIDRRVESEINRRVWVGILIYGIDLFLS